VPLPLLRYHMLVKRRERAINSAVRNNARKYASTKP
jgi:hypothetical protein